METYPCASNKYDLNKEASKRLERIPCFELYGVYATVRRCRTGNNLYEELRLGNKTLYKLIEILTMNCFFFVFFFVCVCIISVFKRKCEAFSIIHKLMVVSVLNFTIYPRNCPVQFALKVNIYSNTPHGKKTCSILQQFTGRKCVTLFGDVS